MKKSFGLKLASLAMLSLGLVAALAGCGSGSSKGGTTEKKEDVTLRIYTWNQDPSGAKREQAIFDEFTKDTGIKVKQVVAPWDKYVDKFMTMASSNTLPDLTWIQTASFAAIQKKGLLMDLDSYVKKNIDTDKFLPSALKIGQIDGKQWALPRDMSAQQLSINTDMLKEAGLSMPKNDWTMDEFLDYAKKLTKVENGKTTVFGIDNFYLSPLLLAYSGNNITNPAGTKITIDQKNDVAGVQFASDLVNKYHVSPTSAQAQGISNMFVAEKSAMAICGPWDWQNISENAKFNWDVIPMPTVNSSSVQPQAGLPIGVTSQTKHKKEALQFLKWLSAGRGQKLQMKGVGSVPVLKSQVNDVTKTEFAPKNASSLVDILEHSKMWIAAAYTEDYAEIQTKANNEVSNIILKNLDAKTDLKKLAKSLRSEYNLK